MEKDEYVNVDVYGVRHTIGEKTSLFLGHSGRYFEYTVTPEEARFLVDLLRNEKPIYHNPVRRAISTSTEPVGEGEK